MSAPFAGRVLKTPLALASGQPWPVLRVALVVAGYLALIGFGIVRLVDADPAGIVYAGGGVAALAFLPRRGITTFVWVLIGLDGAFRVALGDSWRGIEVVGSVIAGLLTALPWGPAGAPQAAPSLAPDGPEKVPDREAEPPPQKGVHIRTLGRLEVWVDGQDYARMLAERPVVSYLFHYLLARTIEAPGVPILRAVARLELNPGLDEPARKERLRKRLSDFLAGLPAALREAVTVTTKEIKLDLSRADLDAWRLRDLAQEATASQAVTTDLFGRLEDAYQRWGRGELLPDWDGLEHDQAGGRGGAGELITSLRRQIEGWRADVVVALASAYAARQQPARALPLLERAHEECPEREDVAERLAATYLITGQLDRAREIRRGYQLSEV